MKKLDKLPKNNLSSGALEDMAIESLKASTFVSQVRKSGAIWWTQWTPT